MFTIRTCLLLCLMAAGARSQPDQSVILEAKDLHTLTRAEIVSPRHVRVKGVLTYKRGDQYNDFAMQDLTGGFIADVPGPEPRTRSLQPGQQIEIEGFTVIEPPPAPRISVTRLIAGPIVGLPEPVPLTPQAILGGAGLFSFVEFSAVIRSTRIEKDLDPHRLVLDFGPPQQRLSARLARFDESTIARLKPDTRVRVRGTALAWTSVNLQPYSIFVGVHDSSQIEVISEPPTPGNEPPVSISKLVSAHPEGFDARRERVRGTVTLHWPGEMIVIQNEEGAIRTIPAAGAPAKVGDEVDVSGFASAASGRIFLDEAIVSNPRPGNLPQPEAISAKQVTVEASAVDREAHRVTLTGTLREISKREDLTVLRMESYGKSFEAVIPQSEALPESLRPGAVLRLTGICHFLVGENARRFAIRLDGFEIRLPSAEDILILSAPPWWTPRRLAIAIAIILFGFGVSLLWGFALRRRVALRSALLAREIRARHHSQLIDSERSRLASDLHDTLSQTLSGAALQLEIADSLDAQEAGPHRELARRLLDRSREDLRRAVWDLTPSVLLNQDLAEAFRSIGAEASADHGTIVEVSAPSSFPVLPERTRSHLLRVGQEAIHNAIRHGKPRLIQLELKQDETNVTLSVADDGTGFDPVHVAGPTDGHFGLSSMRNRIERLGGSFHIRTSPGGTTLLAKVPVVSPDLASAES